MADYVNRRLLLVFGYIAAALAALCMIIGVTGYAGLGIMFALGGIGVGIYEAVEDTIAADLLPSRIRGSGFGALAVVTGLGDWLSSFVVGWLWAALGIRVAFSYALVLMIAGALLMIYLSRVRPNMAAES